MEATTTSNGFEIKRPTEQLDADGYRELIEKFGVTGNSPAERLKSFKSLSADRIAALLSGINRGLQGSKDHLIRSDAAMKIGQKETIAPEYRYDVFTGFIDELKQTPETINPARVGDALAMATILLHPFEDGNGRTARMIGLTFRDDFDDTDELKEDFDLLAESRDVARARGGFLINGYTPRFKEGFDQSDPTQVSAYLHDLLTDEATGAYYGPFMPEPLTIES